MRVHPVTGIYKLHDGTDFRAYCGTPIRAAASGRVLWARYRVGYGNQVAMDHGVVGGDPLMTSYSHLSRFSTSLGRAGVQGGGHRLLGFNRLFDRVPSALHGVLRRRAHESDALPLT